MAEFLSLAPARNFLRRLSGNPNPSNASQHSRGVEPSQAVKHRMFAEHLAHLRCELEEKTETLNDNAFEVTDAWLLEFAAQHAEYMEKATCRAGEQHDFRSTTDLFQHVLQHPSVLKLIGDWHTVDCFGNSKSPPKLGPQDALIAWSPSSTAAPTSPEPSELLTSPDYFAEEDDHVECPSTPVAEPSSLADDEAFVKEAVELLATSAASPLGTPVASAESPAAPCEEVIPNTAAPVLRHRAPLPATALATPHEDGELMQKIQQRASRASCPGLGAPTAGDAGELMRKMRQRANSTTSWQGLSPRSQLLAGKSDSSELSPTKPAAGSIAARRKLLESKLSSCGFQKAAPQGGA